jgi:hypothetical protein
VQPRRLRPRPSPGWCGLRSRLRRSRRATCRVPHRPGSVSALGHVWPSL